MERPTLREASSLQDGRWYRLHPMTPVLRSGVMIAGLLGVGFWTLWETVILRIIVRAFGGGSDVPVEPDFLFSFIDSVSGLALFLVVLGVLGALVAWLQWRVHLVRMDDDVIEIKKGLIFRQSRRARRDRVNTVGVRRPLVPRLLGLAKLDIQAAGNDANVVLAYLPHRTAEDVRREILEPLEPSDVPEIPALREDQQVTRQVEVPLFRYAASLIVSIETVLFLAGSIAVSVVAYQSGQLISWLGLVVVAFVYVTYIAGQFFRVGSFIIDTVEGDVRVSLGLLSTSVETIPPARIHAMGVSQPWPWKLFGWWRIDANLASTPGSQNSKAPAPTLIAPVVTTAEMVKIVALCLPGLGSAEDSNQMVAAYAGARRALENVGPGSGQAIWSPSRARAIIPFSAHVNGMGQVGDVVLLRTGVWVAKLALIPLARVQSTSLSAGPWHRVLGLASFGVQSVQGPVSTNVVGLDAAQAAQWWSMVGGGAVAAIARSTRGGSRPRRKTVSP